MRKLIFILFLATTPALATSLKDAYVKEVIGLGKNVWKIGNSRIELEITYAGDELLLTRLANPQTSVDWSPPLDQASISQPVDVRHRNQEYRFQVPSRGVGFQLTAHTVTSDEKSVRLELVFAGRRSRPELEVSLFYRVYPDSFIETWSEIRNLNSSEEPRIEVLQVGRLCLPIGAGRGHWEIADTRESKYAERERVDWLDLMPSGRVEIPLRGSGAAGFEKQHGYVHTFSLRRDSSESLIGGVYFGHRSPQGFGVPGPIRFTRSPDGKSISAEILDVSATLAEHREVLLVGSNQNVRGLTFIFSFAGGSLSSASTAYQELARRNLMPARPIGAGADFPWVEFNAYFAYDLGFNAQKLKRDVDIAAQLGAEVFIIDAGWWEGALTKCGIATDFSDYLVRVGTYTPDSTSRFPSGEVTLKDFSDYVNAKGMKFGLWVCPFNIDPKHNTGWNPSWLAADGKHLCAAHKAAFDWVKNQIDHLVDQYHVDFLKFDCESADSCTNSLHETARQIGSKEYVITAHQGYDDLITALRFAHPTVAMEDNPLLGHVAASTDDWEISPERGRTELQKARFTDPPQYTAQYLMLEPPQEQGMDAGQYLAYANYIIRSNMLGHIILSSELSTWRPGFRSMVKRHVQIYRQYRHVLTGHTQELAFDESWEALQFQDPESDESLVFAFRKKGSAPQHHLVVRSLRPEKVYRVSFEDRKETLSRTGKELMTIGIPLDLQLAPASEIVYIRSIRHVESDSGAGDYDRRTSHVGKEASQGVESSEKSRPGQESLPVEGSSSGIKTYYAPYLDDADGAGRVVVFKGGSDFDPETYDLGFDGNVGTLHVPLQRLHKVCPSCPPPDTHCGPALWNCVDCPHLPSTPGYPDSDFDSLPDWWEELFGLDLKPREDNDGDGLDNYAEYLHMTNPLSADTDLDGWSDPLEVGSFETDPLRAEPEVRILYVDPSSPCRDACGTRQKPYGSLRVLLQSNSFAGKTLVLVATGVLKESIEVKGYLPAKSFLGLFGGFDPMTWTRREGQTILEDSEGERALRISSASSKPGRIVVEGFTIKGGVLIEGSENAFARVKLARNQIINSPQSPGVEVRSNPGGQVHLVNDYISGNKGGVLSTETWLLVLNCTVVNNDGAGIKAPPGNVSARGNWTSSINNIVWTNSIDVVGFNTVMATICQGEPRCVPKNPALLNGSYRISPDSPARDAGISPLSQIEFLFDLEGQPRVVGPGLDLGAFEIQK